MIPEHHRPLTGDLDAQLYGMLALNVLLGSWTDFRGIGYWGTGIRKSGGNNRHQRRCGRSVRVFAFTSWGYKLILRY